jgi:hypothetical protein
MKVKVFAFNGIIGMEEEINTFLKTLQQGAVKFIFQKAMIDVHAPLKPHRLIVTIWYEEDVPTPSMPQNGIP